MKADPDTEQKIYPAQKMTETFTYQNDYVCVYQVVYPGFSEVIG
jgi:hypothetical protein